jgi:ArsR family transcriptional regulator
MPEFDFEAYTRLLKAMAHPTRLRIIDILQSEPICVKNIGELMDVNQANLSQHLSILRHCGIVSTCREGNHICYSIKDHRATWILDSLKGVTVLHSAHSVENA